MADGKKIRKSLLRIIGAVIAAALLALLAASLILAKPQEEKSETAAARPSENASPAVSIQSESDLVSLIVDIAGARSYLEALGDQVYFLYVTGDLATLKERMLARGDDPEKVARRLTGAELNELPADLAPQAHVLVNQNLTKTEEKLDEIVKKLRD